MNPSSKRRTLHDLDKEILREFEDAPTAEEFLSVFPLSAEEIEQSPAYIAEGVKISFVRQVLQALKRKGWNKSNLAEHVGHSRQYIQAILDDKFLSNFTVDTMVKVAVALGMTLDVSLTDMGATPHEQRRIAENPGTHRSAQKRPASRKRRS